MKLFAALAEQILQALRQPRSIAVERNRETADSNHAHLILPSDFTVQLAPLHPGAPAKAALSIGTGPDSKERPPREAWLMPTLLPNKEDKG
ncbi:hypothetical protein [Sphingosinicella rhizophila]|uniref:Uncharacterized protein n=1 Tax=Sphingosinicella rhizophila TaxID=3050082 RepID=A0ABU3QB87_9SPHN|nr:hypothetical protein [Sphingosinicella sp. GR2756]MDT9600557.1 hypothetical protein [Sphingosinicella sp. GR2756]